MGIAGLDRGGFDAMVDFVQKSYETLSTDTVDPLVSANAEQFNENKEELVKQLDGSIREASEAKHKPVEQLLKDMRGAVRTAMPDTAANPGIVQHFEREGEKARTAQDTFSGRDGQFQLPSVFGDALAFLKTTFGEKPVAPKATPALPTPSNVATPRPDLGKSSAVPQDPRVAEFVATYFGDHFDTALKGTTGELAAPLSGAQKEAFEKLPKEEKSFVLALNEKQRPGYAAMPKDEQTFFRAMKPAERGQFIAMTPDERTYFRALNPDQRASYLTLHPDQRAKVREQGIEGRKALTSPETKKGEEKQSSAEIARTASSDTLKMLAVKAPADGTDTKNQHASLLEKTQGLMTNFLQADPGNVAAARMHTLKALLNTPEMQNALMSDLEQKLQQTDKANGTKSKKSYAEHFKRIRPIVMQHAEKLLRPDLDREGLLSVLAKAVEVSSEFAAAHPPRARDLKAS